MRCFVGLMVLASALLQAFVLHADSTFLQRGWQTDQGLPHNLVNAVVQTRDGYLWVGTRSGLARFDGVQFTSVHVPELEIQNVTCLREDKNENLWIATEGGVFRLTRGKISHFGREEGLGNNNVRSLYESKDGSIWIGTGLGLVQHRGGNFRSFVWKNGSARNAVRAVCEDNSGTLWIGTDEGLCQLKGEVLFVPELAKPVGKGIRCLALDREGNLCVGTDRGFYRRTFAGWAHLDKSHDGLSDDFVSVIHEGQDGRLWIGTYSGLNWLENGTLHTELNGEGMAFDQVNDINEDREGNVWIGSRDGLTRLKAKLFTPISKQQGLSYNNVMSVMEDRAGNYWCGTWGGGIFKIDDNGTGGFTVTNVIPGLRVLGMHQRRDGSLWFGTDQGGGLYCLKGETLTHYGEKEGLSNLEQNRIPIPVLFEDHHLNLWIGTTTGLICLKDKKFTRYTTKDGLVGDDIRTLFEDHEGALWIGTLTGVSRWSGEKFTNFTTNDGLSDNIVLSLNEDAEQNVWVGTELGGLNRLRQSSTQPNRWTIASYSQKNGLFSDEVLDILVDGNDDLWMCCLKGIFRVSKSALDKFDRKESETIPCTSYGKDDGMLSIICCNVAKPAAWKGKDGRLWFATTKGLLVAENRAKLDYTPPPVVIEDLLADKKQVGCDDATKLITNSPSLKISPGRGELEIHYTALSYRAAEKQRFKYRLEGVDADWVNAESRRVAYYNNIDPGSYTFRIVACNDNGVWSPVGASIHFTLLPHIWQTWWFKAIVIVVSLLLAAAAAMYTVRKRMALKYERLERQFAVERERARIAKDIHDDLGASLTRITFLGELAETDLRKPESVENYVRRIVTTARDTVRSLDEIVWAITPRRDTLNSLVEYVAHYANEFLEKTDLRCRLDLPESVPEIPLPSEVRHSLFLVIKEALNNAVKHACASEILISMKLQEDAFAVEIRDNGSGFNLQTSSDRRLGNGLENMRKRIEAVGGKWHLESVSGCGTKIWFEVKLPRLTRPSQTAA